MSVRNSKKSLYIWKSSIENRKIIKTLNDLGYNGFEWYGVATDEDLERHKKRYALTFGSYYPRNIWISFSSNSIHEVWGKYKDGTHYNNFQELLEEIKEEKIIKRTEEKNKQIDDIDKLKEKIKIKEEKINTISEKLENEINKIDMIKKKYKKCSQ